MSYKHYKMSITTTTDIDRWELKGFNEFNFNEFVSWVGLYEVGWVL